MRHTSTETGTTGPLSGLETVSVAQAARALAVTADTIYRACHSGKLPYVRLGGGNGSIRIPRSALEALRADWQEWEERHAR